MQFCIKPAAAFSAKVAVSFLRAMGTNGKKKKTQPPVEVLDVTGLAQEWDSSEDIRSRLRDGHTFINPETENYTVQGCCKNATILIPILTRMAVLEFRSLPPVEGLRDEIHELMTKNKRGNAPEQVGDIIKAAAKVKKLCGFVKMKSRREEPTTVTWPFVRLVFCFHFHILMCPSSCQHLSIKCLLATNS